MGDDKFSGFPGLGKSEAKARPAAKIATGPFAAPNSGTGP